MHALRSGVDVDDILKDFIAETREGLAALDSELVRFEQNPDNPDLLGEIFRLIHTIKGTCGFIGLGRMQAVAHAAETVLGGFRDGTTPVSEGAVSAVLDTVDVIRLILDGLEQTGEEPAGDDTALVERLELAANATEATPVLVEAPPANVGPLLPRLGGEATVDAAFEMVVADLATGDANGLGAAFAGVDTDRLQAGLRECVVAVARGFSDRSQWIDRIAALSEGRASEAQADELLAAVCKALRQFDIADTALAALCDLLRGGPGELNELAAPAEAAAPPAPEPPPERLSLVAVPTPAAFAASSQPSPTGEAEPVGAQTIRVGVDALEHLMTVASELVLIRNQLLQLLRLEPESPFAAPLHRLNQVTSELQEGVMTTRMQPISGAWAKLPRLVRDLARDLGKKIDLQLHGQDTELDRQVLELIKDPLTHMIRNAADHGLETPIERLAAGKPELGRISLSARHEGGAIVIEIADDGRGLSAAHIRAKAVAKSLITPQQAEAMSEGEARRLIFLPGFSTAEAVTSVSGRGVGMDVVRTNVERIGGVIELASVEGQGSRFVIRIPLTLTIVSALIIECGGERFAMPQAGVVELVSASDGSANRIEYIDGAAVLRLRDRLLPLVSLQRLLCLPEDEDRSGETCIVVVRVGSFNYGVIVDRVFDTEEIVVKPVASVLRHLRVYSGATILGDGAVILILDFKGLSPATGSAEGLQVLEGARVATVVEESSATLVFRAAAGGLRATPLSTVSRIEEVDDAEIECVDGRSVLQYRGRLMPVVQADGRPVAPGCEAGTRPMLVFARDEASIGVVVDEIVDIVDAASAPDLTPNGSGSLGSLIIHGQATDLVDVSFYWRAALGGVSSVDAPVAGAPKASTIPLRRLLIVDRSPFCQLLLRPLLAQAGYDVVVAEDPGAALALHDRGEGFDLIMADTGMRGPEARQFAGAFARAGQWHATPLLGLGLPRATGEAFDETTLLAAVEDSLAGESELRGAA